MKKLNLSVFILLLCLIIVPVAFAGWFDGFSSLKNKITGNAVSGNITVAITLGNSNTTIYYVTTGLNPTPAENSTITVNLSFYANDSDGCANINPTTAQARFQIAGVTRQNLTCTDKGCIGAYGRNFSCGIKMYYFDNATDWLINVSVRDYSNYYAENSSVNMSYQPLYSIGDLNASLSFSGVAAGSTNITSTNNISIFNTGNKLLSIKINASDLVGQTDSNYSIYAANFSMSISGNPCAGNLLANDTDITLTGTLPYGNITAGQARKNISTCLIDVPSTLISQNYASNRSWYVTFSG